jgi:hypothetical protein
MLAPLNLRRRGVFLKKNYQRGGSFPPDLFISNEPLALVQGLQD